MTNPATLLEKIMESIFDIFPHADRAFIMLRDKASRRDGPVLGRTRDACADIAGEFPVSRTIINTVVEKKQSILSSDAQKDDRFVAAAVDCEFFDTVAHVRAVYLQGRTFRRHQRRHHVGRHAFNSEDLAMLTSIAGQAAIAIKNADLFSAVEKETTFGATLSRYLSKDVVEGVIDGTIPLHARR